MRSGARMLFFGSIVLLTAAACTTPPAQPTERREPPEQDAPSALRGELLYENHCLSCHTSKAHIRENRRARSVADVEGWVARWANELNLTWTDEEIRDVAEYLVRRYYRF